LVPHSVDGGGTCNRAIVIISLGRLCFLVGCDPRYKECDYACLERPTNHKKQRRRKAP